LFTVSVSANGALVPAAFVAVIDTGYDPAVPAAAVPLNAPVVVLNVIPDGRLPDKA
jgi:hypothetical protein